METVAEPTQQEGTENAQAEGTSAEKAPTSVPISAVTQIAPPSPKSPTQAPPILTPATPATQAPTTPKPPKQTASPTPKSLTQESSTLTPPTPKLRKQEPLSPKQEPSTPKPPTSTSTPATSHPDPPKKSKREDRNKKEDEYVKQFMKAINSAPTLEEKMQIATQRYAHMVDDNKKMQFYIKQSEKRHAMVMKEKEQLQLEFNKTILVKSKLENLCRELQKQNKTIKEESLLKIREEEERRKETQAKFQNTLSEITALLQQNNDKNAKLRDDNISMTEKFKNVVTQYQLREQQIEKMAKQMSLEQQLADAKFMKASLEHQAERARLLAEMEGLRASVQQHRARVQDLQGTETGLRSQLAVYTDKYDEFQSALVKSNQVFGGFKEEMEKMSKKIKKLEKESLSWKKRWETSQTALLDMCGERQASEERAAGVARQLHNMQSLCRTLQAERTVLLSTLKENNIERPPLPAPVPAPPPPPQPAQPASNAKVDAMAANCAQLRQSLAHLQSQLNVLTTKQQQPAAPEEAPKPEKSKKSKSKKSKKQEVPKESESDSNAKESATESANEEKVAKLDAISDIAQTGDKTEASKSGEKVETIVGKVEVVDVVKGDKENATADEKVDDKTLESLIQAINSANINLCDLEVVGDDKIDIDDVLDVDSLSKDDEVTKSTDTASNEASEIESSNKDSSNEDSPKNGPKIVKGVEEIRNGVIFVVTDRADDGTRVVDVTEEIANKPKIVELTDEIASRPKIVELTDEIASRPKIVELTDKIARRPKIIELPDEIDAQNNVVKAETSNIGVPKEVKHVTKHGNQSERRFEIKDASE